MKGKWLRIIAGVLCAAVFCYAAFQLVSYYTQQTAADTLYGSVQAAVSTVVPTTTTKGEDPPAEAAPAIPITVDFDSLRTTCKDVVGWLYIPDTPINYPVVRGEDNDYYLHRMPDGTANRAGSLFADYRNGDITDKNFLVYGHSMKNGTMFGTLEHYAKQAYYDAHPTMYYLTPDAAYAVRVYAGYTTTATSDAYTLGHTEESLSAYMAAARERSDFLSAAEYTLGDTVITLSTCAYDHADARYVLLGIPERIG